MINLDQFQKKAISSIDKNMDVLVVSPTGSGKTLIAEYAIEKLINEKSKVIYTAPIKALSNQKYNDFKKIYGDRVGILTGDRSINKDAPLLILTTEILRNMIFTQDKCIDQIGLVVLDEIHFLGDKERGKVWEEIIIHLSKDVRLVYLSATIRNTSEFQNWLVSLRGPTDLIVSETRPVPLISNLTTQKKSSNEIINIINLKSDDYIDRKKLINTLVEYYKPEYRNIFSRPYLNTFCNHLLEIEATPAIYFLFSREKTESYARRFANASGIRNSSDSLNEYLNPFLGSISIEDRELLNYDELFWMWSRGVSYHHAGMLPLAKEIVELLFLNNYIDILFATETLALGLNMPAKSVIIQNLYKFDGFSTRPIKGNEYMQLTGRAGRRGIDEIGQSYVFLDKTLNSEWYQNLFNTKSNDLESQFSLSYTTVSGLLKMYDYKIAVETLSSSFWVYQNQYNLKLVIKDFQKKYEFLTFYSFIEKEKTTHLSDNLLYLSRDIFIPSILLLENESNNDFNLIQGLATISQALGSTSFDDFIPNEIEDFQKDLNKYINQCNEYNINNDIDYCFVENYSSLASLYDFIINEDIQRTLDNFNISPGDFVKIAREALEISSKLFDIYKIDIFKEITAKLKIEVISKSIYE